MKCGYCEEEHNKRGKYCSNACKQKDYRRRNAAVTDKPVSVTVTPESVTAGPKRNDYSMTAVEKLFWLPSDQLHKLYPDKPYNFVSKPGYHCYKPLCDFTRKWKQSQTRSGGTIE